MKNALYGTFHTLVHISSKTVLLIYDQWLFVSKLEWCSPEILRFHQDGDRPHVITVIMDLDEIISTNSPINWPQKSCGITTLDNSFWLVHAIKLYPNFSIWEFVSQIKRKSAQETTNPIISELIPHELTHFIRNNLCVTRLIRNS